MDLDCILGIAVGVGEHLMVLKAVPINSAWSKTDRWTPRSTFFDAELHLDVVQDHVIGVHLLVQKPVPVNSAWSKTYIWTPRSTFYDARKLNYTLKWPWTMSLAVLLVLVYIWQF